MDSLWPSLAAELKKELPAQQFDTWIKPLRAERNGDQLLLVAPNHHVLRWVRANLLARIESRAERFAGAPLSINLVLDEINTRLKIRIPPFKLTRREVLIDRVLFDPQVQEAAEREARETGAPRQTVQERIRRYAREIVPAFNAYIYFRLGYWFARNLVRSLYRVRLGYSDEAGLSTVPPDSTVVFLINHRSNMDYILVSYLAAERTALSYAVGEWARIWPLQTLIRSMGAYFVRRNSKDPLYRKVLER